MCSRVSLSSNVEVERNGVRVCNEGVGLGEENGSKVDVMEISDGFREAKGRYGVGVMGGCSEKSSPVVASASNNDSGCCDTISDIETVNSTMPIFVS